MRNGDTFCNASDSEGENDSESDGASDDMLEDEQEEQQLEDDDQAMHMDNGQQQQHEAGMLQPGNDYDMVDDADAPFAPRTQAGQGGPAPPPMPAPAHRGTGTTNGGGNTPKKWNRPTVAHAPYPAIN